MYKSVTLDLGFRLDILVNNEVIIEVKSVEQLTNVHKKQMINYLKLSDRRIGFLVNFNVSSLVDRESLIRMVN